MDEKKKKNSNSKTSNKNSNVKKASSSAKNVTKKNNSSTKSNAKASSSTKKSTTSKSNNSSTKSSANKEKSSNSSSSVKRTNSSKGKSSNSNKKKNDSKNVNNNIKEEKSSTIKTIVQEKNINDISASNNKNKIASSDTLNINKKTNKKKIISILYYIFLFIFIIGFVVSAFNIIKYFVYSNKTHDEINEIKNIAKSFDKDDDDDEINFDELLKVNKGTVGWISVKGTNIDYPFVSSQDNSFYLNHSFDKSYNPAGWIWLDYRNNTKLLDRHSIIYGHAMTNRTMFGSLRWTFENDWLNNNKKHIITIITKDKILKFKTFSVYHIKTTSDYLKVYFENDNEFLNFANMLTNRSIYNFNTPIYATDRIITLSTCYNKTEKTVLHAKLIKEEANVD